MSLIGKWFGFGRDEFYDQGIRYFDRGAYEDAVAAFESCLDESNDPSTVRLARFYIGESYAQLGQAAMRAENYTDAVRWLAQALEKHPNYPDLHFGIARAYGKAGNRDKEQQELEIALHINPHYAEAVLLQGICWYETGRFEEGLDRIGRAIALEPMFDRERYQHAMKCHEAGDSARALANLNALMDSSPCDANYHAQLADSLMKSGQIEQSLDEYEKALALAPTYADVHCRYGQALLEVGRVQEAADKFRRAIEINKNYVEAHAQLGIAMRRLGKGAEARACFKRAVDLDPHHIIASQELARR